MAMARMAIGREGPWDHTGHNHDHISGKRSQLLGRRREGNQQHHEVVEERWSQLGDFSNAAF
jgi:hypothetical protein